MKYLIKYISFIFLLTGLLLPDSLCAQIPPPTFLDCSDVEVCSYGTKDDLIHVDLKADVTNHCISNPGLYWTTHIDLGSDGSVDQALTKPDASGEFPLGVHTITFWAADGCGGVSSCQQVVSVKDCKKPHPSCKEYVIDLLPSSGVKAIYLEDLYDQNTSSDNVTLSDQLSVRLERYEDVGVGQSVPDQDAVLESKIDCDDLVDKVSQYYPCNKFEFAVWVGDEANNWDYCVSNVEVVDWVSPCGDLSIPKFIIENVHGDIILNNIEIVIDIYQYCGGNFLDSIQFVENKFQILPYYILANKKPRSFVHIQKKDSPINGIDVYDLSLLKQFIVHQTAQSEILQTAAGDINEDCQLTIADYLLLRKGILTNWAGVDSISSWRFIPTAVAAVEQFNCFGYFPLEYYSALSPNTNEPGLIGYKLGDLNHGHLVDPFQTGDTRSAYEEIPLSLTEQTFSRGEQIQVSVFPISSESIAALQCELILDPDILTFSDLQNTGTGELTWEQDQSTGHIRILWVVESPGDFPQFDLHLTAMKEGQLSNSIKMAQGGLHPRIYTRQGERKGLELSWSRADKHQLTIQPIIGRSETSISFMVHPSTTGVYHVTLSDQLGRVQYDQHINLKAGHQRLDLPLTHFTSGMYFVRISSGNQSASCSTYIQE